MTTSLVTKPIGAVGLFRLFLLGTVLVPLGCTNLDENPPSAITPGNFYRNEGEVLSSLAGIYAQLRGTLDDYYNVSEISTDEMIVPTRGSDWADRRPGLVVQLEPLTAVIPVRATRRHDHLVGADFAHVVGVIQRAPELSVNPRQAAEHFPLVAVEVARGNGAGWVFVQVRASQGHEHRAQEEQPEEPHSSDRFRHK